MAIEKSNTIELSSSNGTRYNLTAYFKENSTNTAGNTSNITCSAILTPINGYWSTSNYPSTLEIYWFDNKDNSNGLLVGSISFKGLSSSSDVKSVSGTINVLHKDDGTLKGYAKAVFTKGSTTSAWAPASGNTSTENTTLTQIPRQTSITKFTVSKRNETSFTINWQTADIIDYVWYSTNNGSSWTGYNVADGTSGSFNISGLSPNTTYNCKLRVRRKDSQLTTDSGTVSQTTYKAPNITFNSKTETSIKINWSIDTTADRLYYSTNGGSTWSSAITVNGTSGSYNITGLSAFTQYNIKFKLRRSATSTEYETNNINNSDTKTYQYPYISAITKSELKVDEEQTVTLYNPRNLNVTVYMDTDNGGTRTQLYSGTTNGTSKSFTPTANTLYESIPNSPSGNCIYYCVYSNQLVSTKSGTYKVKGTEVPTFNNFTYRDSNSVVTGVTGDNQVMVKGLSNVEVTVSSSNKMVANNSANPSKYNIAIANLSKENINYSTSDIIEALTGTINSSGTQRLNVTAYDSRGLYKTAYKDITVYDYTKPVINGTITRLNNFENQTTIKVKGTYTKLTINNENKNSITNVKYRYRETGGSWGNWINLTTTNNNGNYTCGDVVLSLDNSKSFDFQIQVTDMLQQVSTSDVTVDVGIPIFFISTNNKTAYINNKEILTQNYANDITVGGKINNTHIGTVIVSTANTDLNNYTDNGYYFFSASVTPTNIPAGVNGWLEVIKSSASNTVKQIWYRFGTVNSNDYQTFIRTCIAGTWGNWVRLATMEKDVNNIALQMYPVGSIYMSVNSTSPATLFGGTWVQIKDRFLLACGDTYSNGATGGSATINLQHDHTSAKHKHTSAKHSHDNGTLLTAMNFGSNNVKYNYNNKVKPAYTYKGTLTYSEAQESGTLSGGIKVFGTTSETTPADTGETTPANTGKSLSTAQSIMPPYLAVYVWKRTA